MSLFSKPQNSIAFSVPDPLGGGLAEAIEAEQAEPEAIVLDETPDVQDLVEQWTHMIDDIRTDPEQFNFVKDEE